MSDNHQHRLALAQAMGRAEQATADRADLLSPMADGVCGIPVDGELAPAELAALGLPAGFPDGGAP